MHSLFVRLRPKTQTSVSRDREQPDLLHQVLQQIDFAPQYNRSILLQLA